MKLQRPIQADLDRMSHAEKDALIVQLFDVLEGLERRVGELEGKVEKTSRNSSKPPSSDGLRKASAEPRRRGEKNCGGQLGHPGSTRMMVESPDTVVDLRPHGQCLCGAALAGQRAELTERRQSFDIPEPRIMVTEYRQWRVECACGQAHDGVFPAGITPNVSYGPRIKAYAVGLVHGHFVALERAAEILGDQYGIRPSDGTLQRWVIDASDRVNDAYVAAGTAVAQAVVAHFDESGMRIGGTLHWLHVATCERAVHYTAHAQRGQDAMDAAGILPRFQGCAVHDHWKPYWRYDRLDHALCNAHHLRELRYFEESTGHFWPMALRRVLLDGKLAVAHAHAEGATALAPEVVARLLARYDEQVANGLCVFPVTPPDGGERLRVKQHPATNLLLRLRDFKTEVWRFLSDWRVPFDNNRAERYVRPVKVKLKVIGGFRALGGSKAFCVIRSVWETSKLNGKNPFETLRLAFAA
jgi:transposase